MRVCVTGGAGFIGCYLVNELLSRGHAVQVLDNLSVGRRENLSSKAKFYKGDILDRDAAIEAFEGCDAVFHLAARVAVRSSFEFVVEDASTNVVGTANVLRAAKDVGTIGKVVSASSMAVYADSPRPEPVDETHPTIPISPYGVSKLATERLTHLMCAEGGMESAVLRLFNTYGPGQTLSPYVGVLTIFVNELRAGNRPTVFGDGEQRRDFVHVRDVAQGFALALEAPVTSETFNIGTGIGTSINEVLETLAAVMGTSSTGRHADVQSGEIRFSIADIGKARNQLRYDPHQDFATSLGEVVREILTSKE